MSSVRDFFKQHAYTATISNKERKRIMESAGFVQLPCPQSIKVSSIAKWCDSVIGHHNFVICQNAIFFTDVDAALKYKLMFELNDKIEK
jgi:hypothetical protein